MCLLAILTGILVFTVGSAGLASAQTPGQATVLKPMINNGTAQSEAVHHNTEQAQRKHKARHSRGNARSSVQGPSSAQAPASAPATNKRLGISSLA